MKKIAMIVLPLFFIANIILIYYISSFSVVIFGNSFPKDTVVLNLNNYPINTSKEWINKLGKFTNLKRVVVTDKTISKEEKIKLQSKYPNIIFEIVGIVDLYGNSFRDDIEEIDLSNANIDDDLLLKLINFNNLKKVILTGKKLDKNFQLQLIDKYPEIYFEWDVEIAGKTVNSSVTDLDLKKVTINDIEDFKSSLKLLQKLTYVNLSDCNLSNEQLAQLRLDFPNIKIVWRIYFGVWSMQTDQVAFSVLITNFPYKRLSIITLPKLLS